MNTKMWQGRFDGETDSLMEIFNNSLPIDKAFIKEDISGSIAWAKALARQGVISAKDEQKIVAGLEEILHEFNQNKLTLLPTDEDIHMAVERLLFEKIGTTGLCLHTGRSRNDQVVTDFRLYIKNTLSFIINLITDLQKSLLLRSESEIQVIVPGYTHLQQAQPISLAQYWLSFLFLLERDKTRCFQAIENTDCMPLGSGALAGSGFNIDRKKLAQDLGFAQVSDNSIDGVAARDFVLETLSTLASLGIHCSRYAEDLIIWSSYEFGFIELDDAWSTGSSMMPQKKNPDSLELIRGKCGRFIGNYTRFAATLKGLGLTYYKDLQEDKEPVIDSFNQIALVLKVFRNIISTLKVKQKIIGEKLDPLLLATDIADYLVNNNMPFREAHKVVGNMVKFCLANNFSLSDLPLKKCKEFSPLFNSDFKKVFNWKKAINNRNIQGGTGLDSINVQLKKARELVNDTQQ